MYVRQHSFKAMVQSILDQSLFALFHSLPQSPLVSISLSFDLHGLCLYFSPILYSSSFLSPSPAILSPCLSLSPPQLHTTHTYKQELSAVCVHCKIVAGLVGAAMVLEAVALAAFCYCRARSDLGRPAIVSVAGA